MNIKLKILAHSVDEAKVLIANHKGLEFEEWEFYDAISVPENKFFVIPHIVKNDLKIKNNVL